jgi:hypothetical protein
MGLVKLDFNLTQKLIMQDLSISSTAFVYVAFLYDFHRACETRSLVNCEVNLSIFSFPQQFHLMEILDLRRIRLETILIFSNGIFCLSELLDNKSSIFMVKFRNFGREHEGVDWYVFLFIFFGHFQEIIHM